MSIRQESFKGRVGSSRGRTAALAAEKTFLPIAHKIAPPAPMRTGGDKLACPPSQADTSQQRSAATAARVVVNHRRGRLIAFGSEMMQQVEQRRKSQIRLWIEERLSTENDLVPGAFPMTEQLVNRHGTLCGTLYCLHGPRSVRLVAVHDSTTDCIITYDANGVRRGNYSAAKVLVESYGAGPELAAPPPAQSPVFN